MKKTYPKYNRGDLEFIKVSLSAENKTELDKFSNILLMTNKPSKVNKILRFIIQFYDVTEKDLHVKPTLEMRNNFLALLNNSNYQPSYKREVKIYIKKWLAYRWKDLSLISDFPKLDAQESHRADRENHLTSQEIKLMLEKENNLMWQTLISVLFETGCRPEELLNLKWGQVNFL